MITRYEDVMANVTNQPKTIRRLTYETFGNTDYDDMIRTRRVLIQAEKHGEAISKEVRILNSFKKAVVWAVPGTEIPDRLLDPDAEAPRPVGGYNAQQWADLTERIRAYIVDHPNTSIHEVADALNLPYNTAKWAVIDLEQKARIVHKGKTAYGRNPDGRIRYLWAYRAVEA